MTDEDMQAATRTAAVEHAAGCCLCRDLADRTVDDPAEEPADDPDWPGCPIGDALAASLLALSGSR